MSLDFFGFFKKKKKKSAVRSLYLTDIHSHLIPGLDDGVKTMEEAVALISKMHEIGFTKIITTPHIRSEVYPNNPEIIKEGLLQVQNALLAANIPVQIEAAAEYFVDEYFVEMVKSNAPLMTFGRSNYLLIEFSHFSLPFNYKSLIFDLQSAGYTVVLAHPERYYYFQKNFEAYKDLYSRGVQFQLNLVSLAGYYDKGSIRAAEKLIENGMYSFIGSDMHNNQYFEAFHRAMKLPLYEKLQQNCTLSNDFI